MSKAALILTGGGARAAYQIGVLKAVRELLPRPEENPFPIVCGTSAGAITAIEVALNADQPQGPTDSGFSNAVRAALSLSGVLAWWAIIGPHMLLSFGTGLIVANANAGAVGMFPRLAGTASSIAGLAQMGMGAMGTVTVAALSLVGSRYVAMPLVIGLLPFAFAMLLSGRLLRPAGMAR